MSPASFQSIERHLVVAHNTITGVTTTAPAASPSHQVTHIGMKFAQSAKPATHKVETPIVALMTVGTPAHTIANFATRPGVANAPVPPHQRAIR